MELVAKLQSLNLNDDDRFKEKSKGIRSLKRKISDINDLDNKYSNKKLKISGGSLNKG